MKTRIATTTLALIATFCLTAAYAGEAETTGTGTTSTTNNADSKPGVVQKVEHGAKHAAEATERGVKRAGKATAHGVEWAANGVKRGATATGHAINKAASKVTGSTKTAPAEEGAAASADK
ncbi:MAG TPA: hypothetical protein VL550_02040 [Rhodocyclaceae bacterium]|jgi:hypothetical protein|nr:hypothetical protein [Rhodocyclaceae bacterium]